METRSQKRAEASTSSASSTGPTTRSIKRARISGTSISIPIRSPHTPVRSDSMDPTHEQPASGSTTRSKPDTKPSTSQNLDNNSDKGKERETEIRQRVLNIESHNSDEGDNDSDDGVGILHQNLTSASSALQGLLRKLGAGWDDLLPSSAMGSSSSHQSGRLKKILTGLRADGEEGKQVEALTQLCDMLSIASEESLSTFSVDSFVPVLVGLLNHESNADIMLLAARGITHLVDVLPSSCASVVHYGAVSCFVARLLTIEYMDLAEQSLQALKKISQEHPTACLRAGALMAVLSYLDFFSTGVQRVALSTAANMCKKLPSDAADFVMEAVPLLTNLLQYHDAKVLEYASICLTRIAEAFASSPEKLDELCNHGLVTQAASLISSNSGGGQTFLSSSTYTGLIRLLSTCAKGSPLCAKSLLLLGISGILKDILSGSGIVSSTSISPALSRPSDQIFEIMKLANELLPPLPQGMISFPASSNIFIKGSCTSKHEDSNGSAQESSTREKLLNDQPELLQDFGMNLLPVLIQIYGSSVNGPVRHKCLSVIGQLMYFSSAEMIKSLINVTNISSFLAGILAWKDPQVLVPALQIAEILMEKLPDTFSKIFIREGVVHAVDTLILTESNDKDNDSPSGISSHSRGNRRKGATDDAKNSNSNTISPQNSLRSTVSERAKAFKEKYFPSDPAAGEVGVTDDLLRLKYFCTKLNDGVDDQKTNSKGKSKASGNQYTDISSTKEEELVEVIAELLQELSRGDGVSTFEFIGSGVVASLLDYFTCGYFSKQRICEPNVPKFREKAIRRYKLFVSLNESLLSVLVQKLQNALSSLERFPVVLSHSSRGNGNGRLSSGLSVLSQPFKLRLCRAHGEKSLRDYSSNVVLIDPLASLAAVEGFLWPRVQRSSESGNDSVGAGVPAPSASNSATRRHNKDFGQGNDLSSLKAKGKAVLKMTREEGSGPRTRTAARKGEALDVGSQMKPVDGNTSSGDEELDILPAEIDEALLIEDDDVSDNEDDENDDILEDDTLPLCSADKVHDVKLGDASEEIRPPAQTNPPTNPTSSSSTRGAMSFAAAAMSGLNFGTNRGLRGGRNPLSATDNPPRLVFTANGRHLNRQLTIYQAIQRQLVFNEDYDERPSGDGNSFWADVYTIMYQRVDSQSQTEGPTKTSASINSGSDSTPERESLLDSILQGELPCDLERTNPTYNVLALLRVLEGLNQLAPRLHVEGAIDSFAQGKVSTINDVNAPGVKLPNEEFINAKLTPKLARQMQDALALCSGSLPSWCGQLTKACPFLFPFETRSQYFFSTAFGLSRALNRLQQQQGGDGNGSTGEREMRVGRLQRQKVRVSRKRILDSAAKVMEMYSSQKAVLEVEYFGEVGTGLGPTLEFYTLLSNDLRRVGLGMWRANSSFSVGVDEIVDAPLGLFPRPWSPKADNETKLSKVVDFFRLLGQVMAKALQDGRLLDLPFSTAFYKLVLGQELDLHDIISFDPTLGTTLQELQALVLRKQYLESIGNYSKEDMHFRGVSIEELYLDFSLPGYPEYVLKQGGDTNVDLSSLRDYVSLVTDATVGTGIMRQIEAFKSGFNQVFDISTLQIFTPKELEYLLCGRRELWKDEMLTDLIKFDHGYTARSPAIVNLLEIMCEFTPDEQRAFCQFVTGAPRLPSGGLAALNPKLTIVRKHSSSTGNTVPNGSVPSELADDDLPSVMTCANYLKLPPYSSKEIMYKKLLYAILEGQGSFDLS